MGTFRKTSMEFSGRYFFSIEETLPMRLRKLFTSSQLAKHFFPVSWCLKVVLSYICGFLITWGIPYKFSLNTALGSAFVLVFVSINSYWKRIKEGKCWPEDFLVVCLLFKNELVSMGSRGSTCHSRTRLPSTPTRSHGRQNIRDRIRS